MDLGWSEGRGWLRSAGGGVPRDASQAFSLWGAGRSREGVGRKAEQMVKPGGDLLSFVFLSFLSDDSSDV